MFVCSWSEFNFYYIKLVIGIIKLCDNFVIQFLRFLLIFGPTRHEDTDMSMVEK